MKTKYRKGTLESVINEMIPETGHFDCHPLKHITTFHGELFHVEHD